MTKTAPLLLSLFTMSVLCSSVAAYAGQTPQTAEPAKPAAATSSTTTPSTSTSTATASASTESGDANLPVSLDRIKKALSTPEPSGPPIRKEVAEGEQPRFLVQTQAPRTLTLRSYLDDGTAVPAYVRPQFDPYMTEFLEMTTPDNYKGCGQFAGDQGACASVMTSRTATGLVWQQLLSKGVDNVLRGMFKQAPQQRP